MQVVPDIWKVCEMIISEQDSCCLQCQAAELAFTKAVSRDDMLMAIRHFKNTSGGGKRSSLLWYGQTLFNTRVYTHDTHDYGSLSSAHREYPKSPSSSNQG